MRISVIIPTYNVENYIEETINSVLKSKDVSDVELIVVDDGSSDNTIDVLVEKFSNNNVLKIYQVDNAGAGYARNFGVLQSSGDYVMFLDGDDLLDEGLLYQVKRHLLQTSIDVLVFSYYEFDDQTNDIIVRQKMTDKNGKYGEVVWNKVYKREYLLKMMPLFPENVKFEDSAGIHLLMAYGDSGFIDTYGVRYRRKRANSITTSEVYQDIDDKFAAVQFFVSRMCKLDIENHVLSHDKRSVLNRKLAAQIVNIEKQITDNGSSADKNMLNSLIKLVSETRLIKKNIVESMDFKAIITGLILYRYNRRYVRLTNESID
ncbi:glycosyltransferase family 2 protein [Weissella cibaria]|uniref:glycosyltransferase family 2 protein n=1 Tax=Weissella cibaria TaxID=137591 RepID=UPI001E528B6D|nr:glycosyltransferase family 2 protein [Weissella cibaria]MCC6122203.1 glycosyltransferase family 2 protein [Weissella cibaria]